MLTTASLDLTHRNPEIPGLGLVLDPEALLAALNGTGPTRLEAPRVRSVRIEPHIFCRAAYQCDVAGSTLDADVRACRPQDLARLLRGRDRDGGGGTRAVGVAVLADRAVVVDLFPFDPKLPALRQLTGPTERARLLRQLLPTRPDLWSGELRCLRHRLGRRYVAELRGPSGARALLKVSTPKGHVRCVHNATAFRSSGPLRIARLLARQDGLGMAAFEWLQGAQLLDLCGAPEADRSAVAAAAAALATLHGQRPRGLSRWTREAEEADLAAVADEIGFLAPPLSPLASDLSQRLRAHLVAAPSTALPLHGDFSARHVLVKGRCAAIVDLDWACRGDPADDLGGILAQAERRALCGELPRDRAGWFIDAFPRAYQEASGVEPPERVVLYRAIELFRGARFPFRRQEPDWEARTRGLLERATKVLDHAQSCMPRRARRLSIPPLCRNRARESARATTK